MNLNHAHRILNTNPGASKEEVRRSYRQLCLKYHPDKNTSTNTEEMFKEISNAYHYIIENDNGFRDVGAARAKRAWAASKPPPKPKSKVPEDKATVGDIFGVFDFGEDLFDQIADAAKKNKK